MENVIYEKTIVRAMDSKDGETPTLIRVTKEINAYLIWLYGFEFNNCLLDYGTIYDKESVIERAVDICRMPLNEIKQYILKQKDCDTRRLVTENYKKVL